MNKGISYLFGKATRVLFVPVCVAGIMLSGMAISDKPQDIRTNEAQIKIEYTLREHEGRIGIFKNDSLTPDDILEVYLITLPSDDVKRLRQGIKVYGKEELRSLVEDFTG